MPPDPAPLLHAVADELDATRAELENLAVQLAIDPDIVRGHLAVLQAIDGIGQRQAAAAALLRSPDPWAAAADIPLEAFQRRLRPVLRNHP